MPPAAEYPYISPHLPTSFGAVRNTIRLDQDIVDRFCNWRKHPVVGPDTRLINAALPEYLDGKAPRFEDALKDHP